MIVFRITLLVIQNLFSLKLIAHSEKEMECALFPRKKSEKKFETLAKSEWHRTISDLDKEDE